MMSTRALGLGPALRRTALAPRLVRNQAALRFAAPTRNVQIQSLPPAASGEILNAQRMHRPSSPHFTIYQPQLTWIASIANRVTGAGLSVLLYGFSLAYLFAPVVGLPFSGADVVQAVAALPDSITLAGKAILAAPFAFHSLNGLRHLAWDAGKFLSLKGVYRSGYVVLAATVASTVGLLFM